MLFRSLIPFCYSEWSLAQKYGLCISGGSDFHGSSKPGLEMATGYGKLYIPETILDDLKALRPKTIQNNRKELDHGETSKP